MLTPVLRVLTPPALALWVIVALPALADERINTTADDVAIDGYDTVAYFTDARALKGKPEFEQVWQGSRWWFTSAEHRDLFARDPERYAPQFGGFCTGGLSLGYLIEANPENWSIIDGRLYINHSRARSGHGPSRPGTGHHRRRGHLGTVRARVRGGRGRRLLM